MEQRIIKEAPAPFAKNTVPEVSSKDILHRLLDRRYVMGDINTSDKNPNSDGLLWITDGKQHPVGKIEVQLKTLPIKSKAPKYSCTRPFLSYCESSALPVILIVVDRISNKAYWRHIDINTILEASKKLKGKTVTIGIPLENCIDGVHTAYIDAWTYLVTQNRDKVWNYDTLQQQKEKIASDLRELESKLQNPTNFPLEDLKEIHEFLDHYNYILDREFKFVKTILYPDYWKIGIGIIKLTNDTVNFVLYPVEFKKEQTLVKLVRHSDYSINDLMKGNILMIADWSRKKLQNPVVCSYGLLKDKVLKIFEKNNFPIPDSFIANEYLISFIDRHHGFLGFSKGQEAYLLVELSNMLFEVLPMYIATSRHFADCVEEYNHNIDRETKVSGTQYNSEEIGESRRKLDNGFVPKVKVTIISERYNIELVKYYIHWLSKNGENYTKRQFSLSQFESSQSGNNLWYNCSKMFLFQNLCLFFENIYRLYKLYLEHYFPTIGYRLEIVAGAEFTTINLLHFDEIQNKRPFLEIYTLRPAKYEKGNVYTFLAEDARHPIDREAFLLNRKFDCVFNNKSYEIISLQFWPLEFMFSASPSYTFIKERLLQELRSYFSEVNTPPTKGL